MANYPRIGGFSVAILRVFSAYGAGPRRQIFCDVGERAIKPVAEGRRHVEVFGSGPETRDFVDGRDVGEAACLTALAPQISKTKTYNVGSGVDISVNVAVDLLLANLTPSLTQVPTGEGHAGDPTLWVAIIDKLNRLGFRPWELAQAVGDLASWIRRVRD